jgi:hypothetical protein
LFSSVSIENGSWGKSDGIISVITNITVITIIFIERPSTNPASWPPRWQRYHTLIRTNTNTSRG